MQIASAIEQIESKYRSLASVLDERARRHWAASEARAYGWGGVSAVSDATGMSPNTIRKGLAELEARDAAPESEVSSRLRKPGGGRKRLIETDPQLSVELEGTALQLQQLEGETPSQSTLTPQLLLLSSGEISPFRLRLAEHRADGVRLQIVSDGFQLPRVEIEQPAGTGR